MEPTEGFALNHPDDGLDPEIRRFVGLMSQRWQQHPPLDKVPVQEARRIAEQVRSVWTKGGPPMVRTTEVMVPAPDGPVRIRALDPFDNGLRPALVYLHGGGWTIFSIDTHDRIMREYAARAGVVVIGVDYSMSPESRFPRALEETVAVVRWLKSNGTSIGVDPGHIAIGGDSAGAAMTIAACVKLRDAKEPDAVKAMLLNYGAYDATCSNESYRRYGQGGYMWGPGEMAAFWRNYLGDTPPTHPLACPIHADVHGLPPAFSIVPDCDVMYEESVAMTEKLCMRDAVAADISLWRRSRAACDVGVHCALAIEDARGNVVTDKDAHTSLSRFARAGDVSDEAKTSAAALHRSFTAYDLDNSWELSEDEAAHSIECAAVVCAECRTWFERNHPGFTLTD